MIPAIKIPKISLTSQIFIALFIGVFVGALSNLDPYLQMVQAQQFLMQHPTSEISSFASAFSTLLGTAQIQVFGGGFEFQALGEAFKPLSDIFLRMIKMLIAPLLFATLVVGIASTGDHSKLGRIGAKTMLYFQIGSVVALIVGLSVANWLQPGAGMSLVAGDSASGELSQIAANASNHSFIDTLVHIFPESVVAAMAEGEILQLVVFAVFFALALVAAGDKGKPILNLLESLSEVMFKFVNYVMAFAPLGVFGAITYTIAHNGIGILSTYAMLIASLYMALALYIVIVLATTCFVIRVPFLKMFNAIREPFILAFSTASSESALPKAMSVMERFGVPKHIVAFVLPTGYSFNLDGSTLYLSLATLFIAQMAGINFSLQEQILILLTLMITSKGVAAVPRASLVILAGTISSFGLPMAGIAVILGIDHILDMARTSVNLFGNCVATAVVARWEGVFDDEKMRAFGTENEEALEEEAALKPVAA